MHEKVCKTRVLQVGPSPESGRLLGPWDMTSAAPPLPLLMFEDRAGHLGFLVHLVPAVGGRGSFVRPPPRRTLGETTSGFLGSTFHCRGVLGPHFSRVGGRGPTPSFGRQWRLKGSRVRGSFFGIGTVLPDQEGAEGFRKDGRHWAGPGQGGPPCRRRRPAGDTP